MAISLVNTMAGKWEPEKYKDEYRDSLMQVIEEKVKAGGRKLPSPKRARQQSNVIDLVALLQESLGQTPKKAKGKKTVPRQARHGPQRKAA
jgi:DNA end-binding protein Ku